MREFKTENRLILTHGISADGFSIIKEIYGEDSNIIDVTGNYQVIFETPADVILINTDSLDLEAVHSIKEFQIISGEFFVEYLYFSVGDFMKKHNSQDEVDEILNNYM